ncbi:MAG: methyltransferase domain-containing protein [Deltaproteobacteria bacterium]|nr:methyltransferase domain-containing protein [Deltaproteobacteria bacterium]
MTVDLPYFDILLPELARGEQDVSTAFGRHVHWGYWDDDHPANGSMVSFAQAAERMCRRVCDAGQAADDQQILDVGCGLGGTVASLNDRFDRLELTGLNIDQRQLDYAEQNVTARDDNRIAWVAGDACEMPFADESFDVVLAVECAFHFASRERFFREAERVLRPGGKLALCDFMPINAALPFMFTQRLLFNGYVNRVVGPTNISFSRDRYVQLAEAVGLQLIGEDDVTANTLPTYAVVRRVARRIGLHVLTAHLGTAGMQLVGRLGLLRYVILALEKPAG